MFNKAPAFIILPALFAATTVFPISCGLARDGGIWRSDDFGASFAQKAAIGEGKSIGSRNILSLESDPSNPNILYLGTNGDGLYKSFDSGEIWQKISDKNNILDKRALVYDIAVSPKNRNLVYLSAVQNSSGKVLRSLDGGESFKEIYVISDSLQRINDIEVDNTNEAVIYIATSEGGFLRSFDQGVSWQAIKWFDGQALAVKADPRNSQIIYAVTENQGILKSQDAGRSFEALKIGEPDQQTYFRSAVASGSAAKLFLIDLFDPKILYASVSDQIFISLDQGQSFRAANILLPPNSLPITALAQDPKNPSSFYYSAGLVLYRTSNAFKSWTTHQIPSSRRISLIKIDPLDTNIVYVGMNQ